VTDFMFLIQFASATALIVAPAVLINRLLDPTDGGTLANLFAIPLDQPWPRGVQEEEPTRWRVELLHRSAPTRDVCRGAQREAMLPVNRSTP
jgi:hypothetical protein